jgi:cytochrome c-type biogenesis protein CcmH/NrfG
VRSLAALAAIVVIAPYAYAAVEDDLRDGDKFFDAADWRRAAAAYDRAIAKAPGQVSAGAYGKRAAIYIILEDYEGGLAFVAKAKARYPDAPEILEQEALILWETDRKDDAIAVAEKVVKAKPTAFTNQNLIGEYYATRDQVKTAAAFEAYLANRPPELEGGDVLPRIRLGFAYLSNARAALADGDDKAAQAIYTKAAGQFEYLARKLGKKPNATVNAENGLCAAYTGLGRWDQAINICEHVVQDPRRIDATGSVWFNLSKAYLARRQTKKARSAASEFARVRKNEARGLMLLGDTYFADRDWNTALEHYLRAEKALKSDQTREHVDISIQLGKIYRRLPAPSSGPNKNLELAIDKLSAAYSKNRDSIELALELGAAYIEAKLDGKAVSLTDKLLAEEQLAKIPQARRAPVFVLAGKALFNQGKLDEARQRFEAARELRPGDVQIQRQLVTTINEQAFAEVKDTKASQELLEQALKVDPQSATTLTNIAILSIDRGDCDGAARQLARLEGMRGKDTVVVARLTGRAALCSGKPDPAKASAAFAIAEREAKKANAQLALAEIYAEWAPLTWDTDLSAAVEKLELAAAISASNPDVAPAAKRNLAIALYRRGWKLLQSGKASDAASDFERSLRDPSVLQGTEPLAFELSLALAQLDANRATEAAKLFRGLAAKGNQGAYLKPTYAKVGTAFFAAYASYRGATGTGRQQACNELSRLEPDVGGRARELVASCWEAVAFDQWRAGQIGSAQKSLAIAERNASSEQKHRLELDRAALSIGKEKLATLESLSGTLPEALVNLGIVYELLGRPRDAYDAWTKAKARGVAARDLQKWLDAKKRIYGY